MQFVGATFFGPYMLKVKDITLNLLSHALFVIAIESKSTSTLHHCNISGKEDKYITMIPE